MRTNLFLRFASLSLILLVGAGPAMAYSGFFPKGVESGKILRLADVAGLGAEHKVGMDLSPTGSPLLQIDQTFFSIRTETGQSKLVPVRFSVPGGIGSFSIMGDGAVLAVSGNKLGRLTTEGFVKAIKLPSEGMKVAAAAKDSCYLYGGVGESQRGQVYLYSRGGGMIRLARMPHPVTAVSGIGYITFLAVGSSIFLVQPGKPLVLVHEADGPVTSMAHDWPRGVFYSTATGVGYVSGPGRSYRFIRGEGARLFSRKGDLYLYFSSRGGELVRCTPTSKFADLAQGFETARKGKK